jgi:hypothetical protein
MTAWFAPPPMDKDLEKKINRFVCCYNQLRESDAEIALDSLVRILEGAGFTVIWPIGLMKKPE